MNEKITRYMEKLSNFSNVHTKIDPDLYQLYEVKRGLRNEDGTGVLVGLTEIGEVLSYYLDDGDRIPIEGRLFYRGYSVTDLVDNCFSEKRFGFEETAFLLLLGELPTKEQLKDFCELLGKNRALPPGFTEDMILKAPSQDIMNKLARAVLALFSYDQKPNDTDLINVLRQSIELIARFPVLIAHSYMAKRHYFDQKSLYLHSPIENLSTAENILQLIRPNKKYTDLEAKILDLTLIIHAEHGGGNNSSFVTHSITSTGTDTYSVIAGAIGSLKGPQHGGASNKAFDMMQDLKANVKNWRNENELRSYLTAILNKEAYDKKGLIYGIGHAVYTLSDPRTSVLKNYARTLAFNTGLEDEYLLYTNVERLARDVFHEVKNNGKVICANVDFYSGFVFKMLNIPCELFTPLFAAARIAGWCAHRLEEIVNKGKIIRPAYKSVSKRRTYTNINDRLTSLENL